MGLLDRFKKNQANEPVGQEAQTESEGNDAADVPDVAAPPPESAERKSGLWSRFRQGLKRTRAILNTDIRDLLKRGGNLVDDAFIEQLFAVLVKTDMGGGPAGSICERVKEDFRGRVVQLEEILQLLRTEIRERMDQPEAADQLCLGWPDRHYGGRC